MVHLDMLHARCMNVVWHGAAGGQSLVTRKRGHASGHVIQMDTILCVHHFFVSRAQIWERVSPKDKSRVSPGHCRLSRECSKSN